MSAKDREPPPPAADVFRPPVDDRTPEQRAIDRAITAVARCWSSLPTSAAKRGWFEVAAGDPNARIASANVPDGQYRLESTEWVLTIKDGALVRGDRIATRTGDSDGEQAVAEIDRSNYRTVIYTV